jgi:hypothetical protein
MIQCMSSSINIHERWESFIKILSHSESDETDVECHVENRKKKLVNSFNWHQLIRSHEWWLILNFIGHVESNIYPTRSHYKNDGRVSQFRG